MKFRLAYRLLFLVCFQLISSFVFSQTIGGTRPIDDFDGDGIINSVDLDDDNDGVPDSEEYCSSSITLPATNTTAGITEQAVPAGWVISNSSPDIATTAYSIYGSWISTCTGTVPKPPNGHNSWVNFYSNTQEAFKTTLSGLVVGKTYILKVYYAKFGATAALGKITTKLGTTIIDDYRPSAGCGWETRYISFTATATAQDLQFQNTGLASPMQNASVSVSSDALYEVCDTDNDGLPNQFDLDSDGDGCPDAKEAGVTGTLRNGDMKNGANGGVVTTTVSTAGAIAGLANSYGANGLADNLESPVESGVTTYASTYTNYALAANLNTCVGLDTDSDGVLDIVDIDDDNDGALDTQECDASPKKVLFAGSAENASNSMRSNFFLEFKNNLGIGGSIVEANIIENATVPAGFYDGYDMVVFGGAAFNTIHPNHWAALKTSILNKTSNAFIIQSDNCCVASNRSSLMDLLNSVYGTNYAAQGTASSWTETYVVNTSNTYNPYFTVSSLKGAVYVPIMNVATQDILLKSPAATNAAVAGIKQIPGTTNQNQFVAWFVDGSMTQTWSAPDDWYGMNQNRIATLFNNIYAKTAPLKCDTDNDGIPNHLDLDSDGDGCSDAIESKSSTTATSISTYPTGADGNTNGLLNVYEGTPAGSINYISTYNNNAINASKNGCLDSDTDGVADLVDLDDDNDGILDAVESPSCFYTPAEWNSLDRSTIVKVSSQLTTLAWGNNFDYLTNGLGGLNGNVQFSTTPAQNQLNNELLKFSFLAPIKLDAFYIDKSSATQIFASTAASLMIQGSNDNNTWTNLLSAPIASPLNANNTTVNGALPLASSNKFVIPSTAGAYQFFRLTGVLSANVLSGIATGVYFDVNTSAYQASKFPKASCISDTDGDQIPNHLDLDSDGDACVDAKEAGIAFNLLTSSGVVVTSGTASATFGNNGFANTLETVPESGIYAGSYAYANAASSLISGCFDSDGDNVADIFDLDDDNDGILDAIEMTNCNSSILITPGSATSSPYYGGATAQRTIDGTGFTGSGLTALATAPATLDDAWLLKEPLTEGFIDYALPANSNIGGVVLWAPDAYNYGGGDGPPKDFTVEITYNNGQVFTTGVYTTAQPNGSGANPGAQVFNFPKTFTNASKVKLNILNGWYDINNNSLNQVSTDGLTVNAAYNMFLGEFRVLCGATDIDTDNDGIPNRLDLDSDGDGCPDAKEAGVIGTLNAGTIQNGSNGAIVTTTAGVAGAIANGGYGTNGLADALETVADNGIYSSAYNYGYAIYAGSSVCLDSDGDNITDVFDLDDDNDGVLDQTEQSSCSTTPNYTLKNINGTTTGALGYNAAFPSWMLNSFTESQDGYKLIFDQPVSDVVLQFASIYQDDRIGDFTVKLKDGTIISGLDFNLLTSYGPTNSVWTPQPNNTGNFNGNFTKYFGAPFSTSTPYFRTTVANTGTTQSWGIVQLKNIAGAAEVGISELSFRINGGTATSGTGGLAVFASCFFDLDTDNDGIENRLDLDSDGDGCTDAKEAGVTGILNSGSVKNGLYGVVKTTTTLNDAIAAGPYGNNGLADALEIASENGLVNFTSKYSPYAVSKNLSICADTDLDGVFDMTDIDDDNDGVLDADESPLCFYTASEWLSGNRSEIMVSTSLSMGASYKNPEKLLDGDNGTATTNYAVNFLASTTAARTVYAFKMPMPVALKRIYVGYVNANTHFNTGTVIRIEGSNDNTTWSTLGNGYATVNAVPDITGTTNYNTFTVEDVNINKYLYYRIYWVSGGGVNASGIANEVYFKTPSNYIVSANPKSDCTRDTDGDGLFNHLDLDSDGDGCSDAIEAESSIIATSVTLAPTGADGNNNGLLNVYEGSTAGTTNYTSKYEPAALSKNIAACADTDGDGIADMIDLDDDNDGILDATESPDCFYTENDWHFGNRPDIKVSSELTMSSPQNQPQKLVDGKNSGVSYDVRMVSTTASVNALGSGRQVYKFNMNIPVKLSKVYLGYTGIYSHFNDGTKLILRGSNDGTTWTNLSGTSGTPEVTYDPTINTSSATETSTIYPYPATTQYATSANIFSVTQNADKYQYYDIYWVSGGGINATGYANEVYFDVASNYIPSAHPKIDCTNDTDGDGILNHRDLDSDGDGCPDAKEAGITATLTSATVTNLAGATIASGTTSSTIQNAIVAGTGTSTFGNNGFANSLETSSESGLYNGTYDYSYASNKVVNTCLDSDGDGVPDVLDLDDDNDGVLDIVECPVPGKQPLVSRFDISSGASKIVNLNGFPEELWVDIWSLDNNFSLQVNGTNITNVSELNFAPMSSATVYAVPFTDVVRANGTAIYPLGAVWNYPNASQYPLIRVKINKNGYSKIYGYDFVNGTGNYQELLLVNAAYQKLPINQIGDNTVVFDQDNTYAPSFLNAEFNTFNSAGFCDTDGDGLENRLDLDSDGDGCSDAYEAKTTTSTTANFQYANNLSYGSNGFLNTLETIADNGIYNGYYPYDFAINSTIKSCLDSDTDGVPDVYDFDDDNDGILDAIESPSCFYTLTELSNPSTVSTELNLYDATATYAITNSIDGLNSTFSAFKAGQFLANKEILKYTANGLIDITSLTLDLDFRAISTDAGSTFRFQGSADNVLWDNLNTAAVSSLTYIPPATLVLTNNLQAGKKYKYFRLLGIAGTSNFGGVANATFNLASSNRTSANPKPNCTNDLDGDGIPNHLDLDSDGDACPDAKEAGVIGTLTTGSVVNLANLNAAAGTATSTTNNVANAVAIGNYSANGFADALETGTESGNYSATYNYDYAINKLLNACTDTDSDGVSDLFDIDDDNDGILDAVESPTCFYNATELSNPISISSELLPNSTNVITRAIDGDAATSASFTVNQNWIAKEIFKVVAISQIPISGIEIDVPSGWSFSNTVTTNTFKLQGSTDNFIWTDLSATMTSSLSAATLSIANTLAPNSKFKYFRVIGVGGVSYYAGASEIRLVVASNYIQSQYTKPVCLTGRNDADLIPNHLDLDSDGDGCSDALEAGTTSSTTANFKFSGSAADFGANGFYNTLEKTNAESNLYKGVYTYYYADNASFNACTDTDGDGVSDLIDIDDDNDGILDAVESPSCFYSNVELSKPISVSTELLPHTTNLIGRAIDADGATASAFAPSQNWVGKELFNLEALFPISVSSLDLDLVSWALSSVVANTFKLQGSADNIAWIDLSTAQNSTATTGTFTLQNTIAPTNKYKYYRIIGVAGVSNYGGVKDIRFNIANSFVQSQYTNPTCLTGQNDGDLIPNHLDLDSDGDGCSDALEAGTTTSTRANFVFTGSNFGANGFLNSVETGTESGVYSGTYYYEYATNSAISTCTDRDGDGVPDYIDLDNDNDGILDAVESPACFYTLAELANPAEVSSELTQHTSSYVIGNSIDGVGTTASAFATGQDWIGKEIFKFTAKNYILISGMSFDLVNWALSSAAASTFKLQGSGDNASWKDLSAATFSTATTGTFTISNTLAPTTKFKYFRLIGVAGTSSYGGVNEARLNLSSSANASANPKNSCTTDTDADGILNQNDLDSDGDGCPDAIEAGSAPLGTTAFGNTSFFNPSITGANGFANNLETATESGVYSGTYKYVIAIVTALNGCLDSDGDGVSNLDDIDDDNDGITDLKELNCTLANSTDGTCTSALKAASTYGIFTHCSGWDAFDFDPSPSVIDRADFDYMGVSGTNPYFDLQGSYTGPNITGKMVKTFATTPGLSYTFEVNLISVFGDDPTTGSKPYLRAIDASTGVILGTTYLNGSGIRTLSFTGIGSSTLITLGYDIRLGNIGSLFWKGGKMTQNGEAYQICSLQDTDNDGVPNQLDLDSDGDGCPDAVEAGTTYISTSGVSSSAKLTTSVIPAPYGANGFANGLETATESGLYTGTYTYNNATDAMMNACLDSDADGVPDVSDLDDDNDGVLDTIECPALAPYNLYTYNYPSSSLASNVPVSIVGMKSQDVTLDQRTNGVAPNLFSYNSITNWKLVATNIMPAANKTITVKIVPTASTNGTYVFADAMLISNGINTYAIDNNASNTGGFNSTGTWSQQAGGYANTNSYLTHPNYAGNTATWTFSNIALPANCDTDGDGIANQLDLDSDGDGCPDAVESGTTAISSSGVASSAKLTTSVIPAPYGNNGFANGLETSTESGLYTGTYTYNLAADATLNACKDTDGDGVPDVSDLDDDNDGVLDVTEMSSSNSCTLNSQVSFVNWGSAVTATNGTGGAVGTTVQDGQTITVTWNDRGQQNTTTSLTGLNATSYPVGITGPSNAIKTFQNTTSNTITFSKPVKNPIIYAWSIGKPSSTVIHTFSGVNSSTSLTSFPAPITINPEATGMVVSGANSNILTNNEGVGLIKFSGTFTQITYITSATENWAGYSLLVPLNSNECGNIIGTDFDTDGDGIPNRLDLDSDGDGCPDAKESGVNGTLSSGSVKNGSGGAVTSTTTIANAIAAGPYGNNGLANGVETSTESGVVTYTSTYTNNALVKDLVAPTISVQPLNRTVFVGSAIVLTTNAGAPPANRTLTYQWYKAGVAITGAKTATYTITSSATTANADDYYCAIGFVNSCLTTNTNTVNVTVLSNPVGLTACQDANAPLSVTKTGTNSVTYQWKKAGVSLVNGANISGATTSSLTLTNLALADAGAYTLVATDANNVAITSLAGTITITNNTKYVLPTSYSTCATTSTINLSSSVLTSTAGATTTKWQRSLDGGNTWFDITSSLDAGVTYTNFTTATLGITAATTTASATLNGYQYRIATANATCTNYSNVETITINSAPAITTQPSNSVLCTVYATSFTTVATGSNLLYQWQTRPAGNGSWTNITGSNASSLDAGIVYSNYATATLNLSAAPANENNNQYQVLVSNSCGTVTSTTAVLNPTVATPTISGGNVSVCEGTAVSLTASSSTASPTYQWYLSGSAIGGATNATYNPTASGNYSVIANATGYCSSGTASATVTINPLPTVTIAQGAVLTLTSGSGGIDLTATTSPAATYSYTWYNNTTSVSGPSSSNVYSVAIAGSYTVKATNTNTNCFAISAASVITVLPSPSVNGSSSICSGGSVAMSFALATGQTIQWESSTDGTNWTAINNATNANYTATPTNLTNASITIYYHAVVNGTAPTGTTNAIVVTVNPLPTANISNSASGTTLCAGTEAILTASSGAASATYQWYNNNSIITGATASTYTATASGNYSFIVTDGTTSCAASSITSTVTVVSPPAAPNLTATSKIICINTTADLTV